MKKLILVIGALTLITTNIVLIYGVVNSLVLGHARNAVFLLLLETLYLLTSGRKTLRLLKAAVYSQHQSEQEIEEAHAYAKQVLNSLIAYTTGVTLWYLYQTSGFKFPPVKISIVQVLIYIPATILLEWLLVFGPTGKKLSETLIRNQNIVYFRIRAAQRQKALVLKLVLRIGISLIVGFLSGILTHQAPVEAVVSAVVLLIYSALILGAGVLALMLLVYLREKRKEKTAKIQMPADHEIYFVGWDKLLSMREPPARAVLHLDEDPTGEKKDRLHARRKLFDVVHNAGVKAVKKAFERTSIRKLYFEPEHDPDGLAVGFMNQKGYKPGAPLLAILSVAVNDQDVVEVEIAGDPTLFDKDSIYAIGDQIREETKFGKDALIITHSQLSRD